MKTNSFSPLQAAGSQGGSARADHFQLMIEARNRQRLQLTPRELEVLVLLCEGLPNKLIERRLRIGAGTVKCHVASILSKLGVASRLQAVVAAHRLGLLEAAAAGEGADADGEPEPEYTRSAEGSLDRNMRFGMTA